MLKYSIAKIIINQKVAEDTYYLQIETEAAFGPVRPGQFCHIKVPGRNELLLRRPISINTCDRKKGTLSFIVQAKGAGTKELCSLLPGTSLDVLGPLGRGFTMPEGAKRAALVGGGIGAAPLRYIMERWNHVSYDSFIGFRNASLVYQHQEFAGLSENLYLLTDDGSAGAKGFATECLREKLIKEKYDIIFSCGPMPMLKSLQRVLDGSGIPCEVSLEQRMGCGIGACKVCVCQIMLEGQSDYRKVCTDGPVFELSKVVF